jgi:hypothetical protein
MSPKKILPEGHRAPPKDKAERTASGAEHTPLKSYSSFQIVEPSICDEREWQRF